MAQEHYTVVIKWNEERAHYVATATEYPDYPAEGKTRQEALQNLESIMEIVLQALQRLANLPSPEQGEEKPNVIIVPPGPDEF
ncbi:MAG TPA: type II toxin-antitoxin system HicB family antitoxin [Ktedonobacteraceae bacterium]|jgi:predicted RNase H-like HicB family nuclease|nr:type II toxin-antitoxin system HicB family antitoxin [Ktedonobacteraceae bacterium]